jgi:hypothetical protein
MALHFVSDVECAWFGYLRVGMSLSITGIRVGAQIGSHGSSQSSVASDKRYRRGLRRPLLPCFYRHVLQALCS